MDFYNKNNKMIRLSRYVMFILCLCFCAVNCRSYTIGKFIGSHLAVQKKSKLREHTKQHLKNKNTHLDKLVIGSDDVIIGKQKVFQIVQQISLSMGSWYLSRIVSKLDFADKSVLKLARILFGVYILVTQVLFVYLTQTILARKNDNLFVEVTDKRTHPLAAMTGLFNEMDGTNDKKRLVTVRDYDLGEAKKVFISSLPTELFGVLFLHLVFHWNTPLLLAPLSLLSSKLQSPVVQVNLLGLHPVGTLKRPFAGMLDSLVSSLNEQKSDSVSNVRTEVSDSDVPTEGVAFANSSENEDQSGCLHESGDGSISKDKEYSVEEEDGMVERMEDKAQNRNQEEEEEEEKDEEDGVSSVDNNDNDEDDDETNEDDDDEEEEEEAEEDESEV